jgi:hypothetical protein
MSSATSPAGRSQGYLIWSRAVAEHVSPDRSQNRIALTVKPYREVDSRAGMRRRSCVIPGRWKKVSDERMNAVERRE